MSISVNVGNVVVGAFSSTSSRDAIRCLKMIAPGCMPRIKRCPRANEHKRAKVRNKSEARQQTNRVGNYERVAPIRYLKPGEFKL